LELSCIMIKSEILVFLTSVQAMNAKQKWNAGEIMKYLSLLTWVGQFGFSCLFPTCVFLLLGVYLQNRFDLGVWVVILLGIIGFLTSISTARACLESMRKEIDRISKDQ